MTEKKTRHKRQGAWLVGIMAVALLLAVAPSASGHGGNHGTIKVHDEMDAEPDVRNEPHVSCDFWIEGFNMHGSSGNLTFYSWPPTGDMSVVVPAGAPLTWTGTPEDDEDGFHFLNGPYQLPAGHYRVEAFSDAGHPGDHGHFSKTKTFWVDPCDVEIPESCPPVGLAATANGDDSIDVSVEAEGNFTLMRAAGSGAFVSLGNFTGDLEYRDTDTVAGTTYSYDVVVDGDTCASIVVTAIPVFPTILAAVLAVALGVAATVVFRRR